MNAPTPSHRRGALARVCIAALALSLFAAAPSACQPSEPISPDDAFAERQVATLQRLAGDFEDRQYGEARSGYLNFGRNASRLIAKFWLWDRDVEDPNALDPGASGAHAILENLADHALANLGTYVDGEVEHGPWSWSSIGTPGGMHGAMAFGFILNQWGDHLPEALVGKMRKALEETTWAYEVSLPGDYTHFMNGKASLNAGQLLAGEYFGYDSELWEWGVENFNRVYDRVMRVGMIEMNSPIYSLYHYPPLLLAQVLEDETMRNKNRILLEYSLIFCGHLYLPGGSPGAPRGRDRSGGHYDWSGSSLGRLYNTYFGDPDVGELTGSFHAIGAASPWEPPEVLRSLFLDKGEGYNFWGYHAAPNENTRIGMGYYRLGPDSAQVSPWETVVMPGGDVLMGIAYGTRWQSIHVSMGVVARDDSGGFQTLYHYHPWHTDDRTGTGFRMNAASSTTIDDFLDEGYARQRLLHGRTMMQIWDPTGFTHEETAVHLPNWERYGGEVVTGGGWHVGRMGDTFIAFGLLGEVGTLEERDGGDWTFLRLPGRSGSIVELATTADYPSAEAYLADLRTRHLEFVREDPYHVEFEARDPETGGTALLRLEYDPERRYVDGEAVSMEDLDRGLLDSPFVSWDPETLTMTLSRDGYETVVYDVPNGRIEVR